jgi:hypothetical protein
LQVFSSAQSAGALASPGALESSEPSAWCRRLLESNH